MSNAKVQTEETGVDQTTARQQSFIGDLKSRLGATGRLAGGEAKRAKLMNVDLPQAFRDLGRHVHEHQLFRDDLAAEHEAIDALLAEQENLKAPVDEPAQPAGFKEKAMAAATSANRATQSKVFDVRLAHALGSLGRRAYERHGDEAGPSTIINCITEVQTAIFTLTNERDLNASSATAGWKTLSLPSTITDRLNATTRTRAWAAALTISLAAVVGVLLMLLLSGKEESSDRRASAADRLGATTASLQDRPLPADQVGSGEADQRDRLEKRYKEEVARLDEREAKSLAELTQDRNDYNAQQKEIQSSLQALNLLKQEYEAAAAAAEAMPRNERSQEYHRIMNDKIDIELAEGNLNTWRRLQERERENLEHLTNAHERLKSDHADKKRALRVWLDEAGTTDQDDVSLLKEMIYDGRRGRDDVHRVLGDPAGIVSGEKVQDGDSIGKYFFEWWHVPNDEYVVLSGIAAVDGSGRSKVAVSGLGVVTDRSRLSSLLNSGEDRFDRDLLIEAMNEGAAADQKRQNDRLDRLVGD